MIVETLLIGLVVALLWAEITDVAPGGIIVPGYVALYLDRPLRLAATLAVALLTLAVYRFLARRLILFGRRRFVLMVLVGAVRYTHDIETCTKVRHIIKKCPHSLADFSKEGQEDAGEFLQYILSFFGKTQNCAKRVRLSFGTNDLSETPKWMVFSNGIEENVSIVRNVPYQIVERLSPTNPTYLEEFLLIEEDSGKLEKSDRYKIGVDKFYRRIEHDRLVDAPYLIFYINRATSRKVLRNPIMFNETLVTESTKELYLSAIVCHNGSTINSGHYTCYFRCKDKWFYYDDTSDIEEIGEFPDLLLSFPNPTTFGVLYFYT